MAITLTPEQEAWIGDHVAAGDFASAEEGARQLIDERIAERDLKTNELAWAKQLVAEARDAVSRGAFITLEEHRARNAERLGALLR